MTVTIVKPNAKHMYEIETKGGFVQVEANTSSQAVAIAKRNGYEVRSVNMVG